MSSVEPYDSSWIQVAQYNQDSEEEALISTANQNQQSIFKDAMKLGGALMQMINTYKNKHYIDK